MQFSTDPESNIFGIKAVFLIAGFAGGVVSLSYVKQLSKTSAVMAVATGMFFSAFATPAAASWFKLTPEVANLTAFIVGLTAMNIIPGLILLSERFKSNPEKFIPGTKDDR